MKELVDDFEHALEYMNAVTKLVMVVNVYNTIYRIGVNALSIANDSGCTCVVGVLREINVPP